MAILCIFEKSEYLLLTTFIFNFICYCISLLLNLLLKGNHWDLFVRYSKHHTCIKWIPWDGYIHKVLGIINIFKSKMWQGEVEVTHWNSIALLKNTHFITRSKFNNRSARKLRHISFHLILNLTTHYKLQ